MKLIVGLGNPGEKYAKTRHNVGFAAVDAIAAKFKIFNLKFSKKFNAEITQVGEVLLVKPQTFMNKSGETVSKLINFYQIPLLNTYIIHDDLDIRLGDFKIKLGIGPKVHNGINSVREQLNSSNFWYIRIGVDNRTPESKLTGEAYVLSPFTDDEKPIINEVILRVTEQIKLEIQE